MLIEPAGGGPLILSGQALSNGVDCTGGAIVQLTTPEVWTPANISFQVSVNGTQYSDLFDADAREVIVPIAPGATVMLPNNINLSSMAFLKIRSGSRRYPVMQVADRQFRVTLDDGRGPITRSS